MKMHNVPLTSGEISALWTGYMNDSMSRCVLLHGLAHAEDAQIRSVLEYALKLAEEHLAFKRELFAQERFPTPKAFGDEDMDVTAPRLFSDKFMLFYLRQLGVAGLAAYGVSCGCSPREDVRAFYSHNIRTTLELLNRSTDLLLEKGIFVRAPQIPYPTEAEFIDHEGWLAGWLGDRRPLNAIEITHLWSNILTNALGRSLMLGFAQVSTSADIRKFFIRGMEIARKHLDVFSSRLEQDHLPPPMTYDVEVTASKTPPFSEKLMLFHAVTLCGAGIGNYGVAGGASLRRDMSVDYARLASEIATYADDGIELMIGRGWMEKIPGAVEREALVKA